MRRKNFILIGLFVAATFVSGCVFQRETTAANAKTSMIGMSKEAILACMGAPARKASEGETSVWTYMSGDGRQNILIGQHHATSRTRSCKIDVIMRSGRVAKINYSGRTGGLLTVGEQCAYAIENCVGK